LHQTIGQLASALAAKIGPKPYHPTGVIPLHNVVEELKKKRERTSSDSIRPRTPKMK
jgi:hypothetical protein